MLGTEYFVNAMGHERGPHYLSSDTERVPVGEVRVHRRGSESST